MLLRVRVHAAYPATDISGFLSENGLEPPIFVRHYSPAMMSSFQC